VLGKRELESQGLARGRAGGGRQGRIDGLDRRARLDQEIELPFPGVAIAERIHLRKFLAGIDMHDRAGQPAEEGLAREPDHNVGILAERPEQRDPLEPGKRFAKDEDALRFELVEAIHRRHSGTREAGAMDLAFLASTGMFFSTVRAPLGRIFF